MRKWKSLGSFDLIFSRFPAGTEQPEGLRADFAAGSLSRAQRSGREAVLFPDAGVFCRGAPEEDQYRGAFVESDTDGGLLLPAPERPKTPAGLFAG